MRDKMFFVGRTPFDFENIRNAQNCLSDDSLAPR